MDWLSHRISVKLWLGNVTIKIQFDIRKISHKCIIIFSQIYNQVGKWLHKNIEKFNLKLSAPIYFSPEKLLVCLKK